MMPNVFDSLSAAAPALVNHLWQSTVFAAAAALLAVMLRKNHARARYRLWLAASAKFLVPFALLVSIGRLFPRPSAPAATQAGVYAVLEQASQPFVHPAREVMLPAVATAAPGGFYPLLALIFAASWLCGVVTVLGMWAARWRKVSRVCGAARPLREGREVEALRRVERRAGVRKPMRMLLSRASMEPAVFGVIRPVLLWPEGISLHLEDAHLEAILAHELCHVRRRDNLFAAFHMAVEAVFWFHPLVWWLGSRLVEDRERACDEAVVQSGNPPQVYAESILKACEFSIGSPLPCAAGVTGSDLKNRIVRIMTERGGLNLDFRKKFLLSVAALVAVALPIAFGLGNGSQETGPSQTGAQAGPAPAFEVASIKPDKPKPEKGQHVAFMRMVDRANDGRFYSTGPTLRMLLHAAYDVQDSQIEGGPSWIDTEGFDIQAKADDSVNAELKTLSPAEGLALKHRMLQALLTDRFKLTIKHETKNLPVYALVLAKNGPKIQPSKDDGSGPQDLPGIRMRGGATEQQIYFQDASMASVANVLGMQLGRTVIDKTGLTGKYDFTLKFAADPAHMPRMMGPKDTGQGPGPGPVAAPGAEAGTAAMGGGNGPGMAPGAPDASGPSIFTAIQQQLGLKLESQKGPVEILVIEHAEQPSED